MGVSGHQMILERSVGVIWERSEWFRSEKQVRAGPFVEIFLKIVFSLVAINSPKCTLEMRVFCTDKHC